ncbi:FxSxx-COOH system tetratricopeptide repeat protein [Streptomyces sp. NPDC090080]|uniref:FxSxx-COOH system tetratricopeptide repeat protein n=1 Tax=Streptomyces sp. NPDC090080 TaxID=3365939 RepID=UPI003813E235
MDPSTLLRAMRPFQSAPRLTLNLVLDRAPSMQLWTRTLTDLGETLGRAPFADVRVSEVDTSAPGELPAGDTGSPLPGGEVVLLVSDCVADAWQDGRAVALLDLWSRTGVTAVLQPLSRSLRHRVGVPLAPFRWRASRPATPTAWVTCGLQPDSLETAAGIRAQSAVPVLGLEDGRSIEAWARHVAAPADDWYQGEGIPVPPGPDAWDGFALRVPAADPADLVRTLEEVAGPAPVRLAALLSAAPLVTLDLLHAVQRGLLPDDDEALPEVFHSGLLVRAPDRDRDADGRSAFVLLDEVVEPLFGRLTQSEARRSLYLAVRLLPPAAWARNTRRLPSPAPYDVPARPAEPARRTRPAPRVGSEPPTRNTRFVGRGTLLGDVRTALLRSDGLCVLYGIVGVGKTQTALEYLHRHRGAYDFVWWGQARDARSLAQSLAGLGAELGVPRGPDGLVPVAGVLERLRSGPADRGWLLVLDNAGPPADLVPLLPLGAGHILITSRHVSWAEQTAHPLRVGPLTREESLVLLRARAPWLTDDDGDAVAERAGDLPPLLVHLGRSLANRRLDVAKHLTDFDQLCARLLLNGLPDYDVKVAVVWKRAVAELADADASAVELLRVLSCLGTGPVPYDLLAAAAESAPAPGSGDVLHDAVTQHLALMRLAEEDLAVFEAQARTVEVHPALLTVMRGVVMTRNELLAAEEAALRLLSAALPADPGTPAGRDRMAEIARRLSLAAALDAGPEATGGLVLAVVEHHAAVGDTRIAGARARVALDSWSHRLAAADPVAAVLRAHAGTPPQDP